MTGPTAPAAQIEAGDLVLARRGPSSRIAVAAVKNSEGRWVDADGLVIVQRHRQTSELWEAWRVPSPGPEPLPLTPGSFIHAVRDVDGDTAEWLVLGLDGEWHGRFDTVDEDDEPAQVSAVWSPDAILAFTDADRVAWTREDAASTWEKQGGQA